VLESAGAGPGILNLKVGSESTVLSGPHNRDTMSVATVSDRSLTALEVQCGRGRRAAAAAAPGVGVGPPGPGRGRGRAAPAAVAAHHRLCPHGNRTVTVSDSGY
jgi:hypothetical protein